MAEDDIRAPIRVPPERDQKTGRFVTGNVGGGRYKGSRNKLSEAMIDDLYRHWLEHGIQAINRVFEERPADYLKIVAMLVSKCEDLSLDGDIRDAAVEQFIEERRQKALAMIAKMREPDDA
jgi:hypothetical protein